ncbi:hypothetical protein [Cyanobium sp. ATX-6F1]|uniref:hypothetical protein n=1 Tax=Cyanobium sp. ATX-6F1 TaxID=3137388 RepID=UPI0039BDCC95
MTAQTRPREVIQTHISVVTLTPRHAFKRKKPLALWGLLDYSTPERRLHWCQEELRLNRRLASDLYLRVARLGPGREPVVVMRRFAATDTLEARLASGRAGAVDLRRLGERIERFHREHPLVDAAPRPMARAFARVLHGNLRATASFCPGLFPSPVHMLLERTLARRLRGQRRELVRRIAAGWGWTATAICAWSTWCLRTAQGLMNRRSCRSSIALNSTRPCGIWMDSPIWPSW